MRLCGGARCVSGAVCECLYVKEAGLYVGCVCVCVKVRSYSTEENQEFYRATYLKRAPSGARNQ
jgi:hypothetical protein